MDISHSFKLLTGTGAVLSIFKRHVFDNPPKVNFENLVMLRSKTSNNRIDL